MRRSFDSSYPIQDTEALARADRAEARTAVTRPTTRRDAQVQPVQAVARFEHHYTVQDLADAWNVSTDTIRRLFEHESGVIIITKQRNRTRVYRTLRIPRSVAERVHRRLQNGGAQ